MKKLFLFLSLICVLLLTATGCAAMGPWHGKVIDAETKQPIEGVVVVAMWWYKHITPTGGAHELLDVVETTTNANGEFEIPARHYISIEFVRKVENWTAFTIYKPGYGLQVKPDPTISVELFEKYLQTKDGVVELPKAYTNAERKERLINVEAGLPLESRSKMKTIRAIIDSERKFLSH